MDDVDDQAFLEMPFIEAVREAITKCNGFVYAGDKLTAQTDLIRWMRSNPEKALYIINYGKGVNADSV